MVYYNERLGRGTLVQCKSCESQNPEGNHFCGKCGKPLDSILESAREDVVREIETRITAAVASWKDQKLVDVETTEAIVNRLQSWAKLFGFFVGIPAFIIIIGLTYLGYSKYTDVVATINEAQKKIAQNLLQAQEKVNSLQSDVGPKIKKAEDDLSVLNARESALKSSLDAAENLAPRLQKLSIRVDQLQEQIVKFRQSPALGPEQQKLITLTLSSFRSYLQKLGLRPPATVPTISIGDKESSVSSFTPTTNEIVIGGKFASNPGNYLWAYAAPVLNRSLKPGGEIYVTAILSRYYQSSYLENDDNTRFADASKPKYNWYSAFWKIRGSIGKNNADRLFVKVLEGAGPRENEGMDAYMSKLVKATAQDFEAGKFFTDVDKVLSGTLPEMEAGK